MTSSTSFPVGNAQRWPGPRPGLSLGPNRNHNGVVTREGFSMRQATVRKVTRVGQGVESSVELDVGIEDDELAAILAELGIGEVLPVELDDPSPASTSDGSERVVSSSNRGDVARAESHALDERLDEADDEVELARLVGSGIDYAFGAKRSNATNALTLVRWLRTNGVELRRVAQ